MLPRLRLDIESDAPCAVRLSGVALSLLAEHALLAEALRLSSTGRQHARQVLALPPPAQPGAKLRSSCWPVEVRADATPPAGAPPAPGRPGRCGLLLEADQRVSGELRPRRPGHAHAGLSLDWHPLSERLSGVLHVLPAAARRGTPPLIEQSFDFDTAQPATSASQPQRLALRWPALDLQAQVLAVELSVTPRRGLWPPSPAAGLAGYYRGRRHRRPRRRSSLHASSLESTPGTATAAAGEAAFSPRHAGARLHRPQQGPL